jgi:MFS family permease
VDDVTRKAALSRSVADGLFGTIWTSLTGGVFLVGYALKVFHASSSLIGILAALPLFANIVQVAGSLLIEKTGKRKPACIAGVLAGRLTWVGVILLPLVFAPGGTGGSAWPLIAVIGLSSLFAALGTVGWTAWMSDLVPRKQRGTFFGRRNMIASLAGMVALLLGGKFLDIAHHLHAPVASAFMLLFTVGLLCGIASVWFLSRIPETGAGPPAGAGRPKASLLFQPLRDGNFRSLILFVSIWSAGVQMAGPFYSVFLIDSLRVDFGTITLFGTCATVAMLLMMRTWGPISDALGNKPVIVVSGWVLVVVPVLWILARPGSFFLPVLLANLVSGAAMAGAALSQFNILIALSPRKGRSMYIAIFAAITGLVGAAAPVLGGIAVHALRDASFTVLSYRVTNLHLLFIGSAALQLASIPLARRIREPSAAAPMAVIMQLKNDLNPQTGIASSADFVMLEIRRGRRLLDAVDRGTEDLARLSEQGISALADRIGSGTSRIRGRLRHLLKEDGDVEERGQDPRS